MIKQFTESLHATGGEVIECAASEVDAVILERFPEAVDFTNPKISAKFSAATPLSELERIDTALINGAFGVAENGAVWIDDGAVPHRIIPFIVQHLVIKTDASRIVATMQEAYRQIRLCDTGFGTFIAGPSKTADIEQSLVYGAHGAVRLTVVLQN
jgi:L-lactate dehydrogenase complex protein LldG